MQLHEFNKKSVTIAKKALKEQFNTSFNVERLGLYETKQMLGKVKKLVAEAKSTSTRNEQNPSYLKLVFMEQALVHHYGELKTLPLYNPRIVVENEEVEKSQVVLAAQEMVDSMQKMVEQVSDMLVKELPAVVDGVNSEFGTNEGQQFNDQVTGALTTLQAAITGSKTTLQGALGLITGQSAGFDTAMPADDMGAEMPADDMGAEIAEPEVPSDEPAEEPVLDVGRSKR
jgi:hypothetical protein